MSRGFRGSDPPLSGGAGANPGPAAKGRGRVSRGPGLPLPCGPCATCRAACAAPRARLSADCAATAAYRQPPLRPAPTNPPGRRTRSVRAYKPSLTDAVGRGPTSRGPIAERRDPATPRGLALHVAWGTAAPQVPSQPYPRSRRPRSRRRSVTADARDVRRHGGGERSGAGSGKSAPPPPAARLAPGPSCLLQPRVPVPAGVAGGANSITSNFF